MSLVGALNIGRSALAATQAAIQVTGTNISNSGSPDHTRQVARIVPGGQQQIKPGMFLGTSVSLESVQRQIDEALQGRLRASISDSAGAAVTTQWLGRIEAVFNELGDEDLSTQLSAFFNSWSNLANQPQDMGLRQVVLQNGQSLAQWIRTVRGQLADLEQDAGDRLAAAVQEADRLADGIAQLNAQIVTTEGGAGAAGSGANALRDQRDALLGRLSELMDIRTLPDEHGNINVFVGSEPLVMAGTSRGVAMEQQAVDGHLQRSVVFKANGGPMALTSGTLAALSEVAREHLAGTVDGLDEFTGSLIRELNKLHAGGQGLEGYSSVSAAVAVNDATVSLADAATGLDLPPVNGSFVVHVKDRTSGLVSSTLVSVDLDGLNGDDTTLQSLAAALDGVADISASVNAGRLSVTADGSTVEVSFSQDSSGVLAALGINTFFTGSSALDIAVDRRLLDSPGLLAAARNGQRGDNQNALAIAALEGEALTELGGRSLTETYQAMVNELGASAASARGGAEAAQTVLQTLEAQRESLSGVSLDEEAVNLMRYQRAYQGAAKLIAAVDEMMRTVLQLL